MQKLIVICGATGVGKTNLSIALAKHFQGEIINADASQVFQGLDIGTAKATQEEMKEVPHHLFSFKSIQEGFSIKEYQTLSRRKIDEITNINKVPFLVGGSGLYINACIYDYDLDSSKRMEEFETQYDSYTNEALFAELVLHVPNMKEKIHPNNRRRILRMLSQIHLDNKKTFQEEKQFVYDCLILFLNMERSMLYERINFRTHKMMEAGWLAEVNQLIDQNTDFSKVQSIGYKELYSVIKQETSIKEALEVIQQKTRRYAKRQITWFKNQLPSIDVEVDLAHPEMTLQKMKHIIEEFLNT